MIPGIDLNKIIDGQTLGAHWEFYTINVKLLKSVTHEEFCKERPNAAVEIERANQVLERLNRLIKE